MVAINYIPGHSSLHKLNPITNLIFLICIFILLLLFSHPIFSFILLILVLTMYIISGIKLSLIITKARFLVYFGLIIFIIQLLFTPGSKTLLTIIPDSSPILPGFLRITMEGLVLGLGMTLRFLVIILSSLLFVSITDPNKLAYSLMQMGLPYRYGFMLVTSLRFIPQFEIEANTVRKAQLTRGIKLEKSGLKGIYNHVKYTFRPLLVSGLQKAETLSRSMEGRGFGIYKDRTYIDDTQITKKDIVISINMILTTIILISLFSIIYDQNSLANYLLSKLNQIFLI